MLKPVQQFHRKIYLIPVLFFPLAAVLSLYEAATGTAIQLRFVFFSVGVAAGWISVATGVVVLFINRKNELTTGLFFIHGFINSIALWVLSAFWSFEYKTYPVIPSSTLPAALLKWLLLAVLLTGIYLGKKAAKKLAAQKS